MNTKNITSLIFVLIIVVLSLGFVVQADEISLEHDGYDRTYQLHIPDTFTENAPLLIALHGGGSNSDEMMRWTGFNDLADEIGFVVAYPDAIENFWNNGSDLQSRTAVRENIDDVGFIMRVIDDITESIAIDRERVYVTGFSNGGMMTFRLACEVADELTGIASVAANMPSPYAESCTPNAPIPTLIISGTDDPLLPYDGGDRYLDDQFLGRVISVNDMVQLWAQNNACTTFPEFMILPDTTDDDTRIHRLSYTNCADNSAVILYSIVGGGHTWSGTSAFTPAYLGQVSDDISATQVIWDFFSTINTD